MSERGTGELKMKRAQEPKTKPNLSVPGGPPGACGQARHACLQRDGRKARACSGTHGARTKHSRGRRGGPGPGRTGPAFRDTAAGGCPTLRGLRHRHKMAATSDSGSAPSPRPAPSWALAHRATQPRPNAAAQRSRRAPLALLRDAEEPAHLKWRTPRLTPPGPSSPHRNRASPAVLTGAGQRGIAGRARLRRTSAPPRALTPRTFRRGSP